MFKNENGVGASAAGSGGFVKPKDGAEGSARLGGGAPEPNIAVCGVPNENGLFPASFCDGAWAGVGAGAGVGFEPKPAKGVGAGTVAVGVGAAGCPKGLLAWGGG